MLRGRILCALAGLALLAGCAGRFDKADASSGAEAEKAWSEAYVILPGDADPQRLAQAAPRLAQLDPGTRLPVVVFAHSCRGVDAEATETLRMIAAHGFAAIAPDHHARADARGPCRAGPSRPIASPRQARRDGGYARAVPVGWSPPPEPAYVGRRLQEVEVALARVRDLPWVDKRDIYLVGHSLGRGTAELWPTQGLAAVAVLGQDCRGPRASVLRDLPFAVAVLPLADRRGAFGADRAQALYCGEYAGLPAFGALTLGVGFSSDFTQPETQRALLDFLLSAAPRG
jgi:dienelactone hydrolase